MGFLIPIIWTRTTPWPGIFVYVLDSVYNRRTHKPRRELLTPNPDPFLDPGPDPDLNSEPEPEPWANVHCYTTQTTAESFTFTDSSSGTSLYVCKTSLDFAIRVTTGQSKKWSEEEIILLQNQCILCSPLAEGINLLFWLLPLQRTHQQRCQP